jgi:hypothetical protein
MRIKFVILSAGAELSLYLLGYFSLIERDQLTRRLDKLEHTASALENAQALPSRVVPLPIVQAMSLPQMPVIPAADPPPARR